MLPKDITIDYYDASRDEGSVLAAWQSAFGDQFRIEERALRAVAHTDGPYRVGEHFVARHADQIVGFAFTQLVKPLDEPLSGSLCAVGVARPYWRQGIGRALVSTACESIQQSGGQQARLGGHVPRFFCGVPDCLPAAMDFFVAQGFALHNEQNRVWDLTQDLATYQTPPQLEARIRESGLTIRTAEPDDYADVIAFHAREFRNWQPEYAYFIRVGDGRDILLARDESGAVVGSLIMFMPRSHQLRGDVIWWAALGEPLGSLAAVGVGESGRGKGIGAALVARGSEFLKAQGVRVAHIGWTGVPEFYEKAGYRRWQSFLGGWRVL